MPATHKSKEVNKIRNRSLRWWFWALLRECSDFKWISSRMLRMFFVKDGKMFANCPSGLQCTWVLARKWPQSCIVLHSTCTTTKTTLINWFCTITKIIRCCTTTKTTLINSFFLFDSVDCCWLRIRMTFHNI